MVQAIYIVQYEGMGRDDGLTEMALTAEWMYVPASTTPEGRQTPFWVEEAS